LCRYQRDEILDVEKGEELWNASMKEIKAIEKNSKTTVKNS
jgi:hypothetical protein